MNMDKALREVKTEKWGKISGLQSKASSIFTNKEKDILKDVAPEKMEVAKGLVKEISNGLADLSDVIKQQKNTPIEVKKREVLNKIGDLEQLMISAFPFE